MISTITFSYRFILLSIVSLFLLFTLSCIKDPTSPDENESQTTVIIGVDGGTLETEDFSLQVPAGSFQNETTLSLSISSDPSDFGESSVSQSFIVEGLPVEFEKPIRLAIKYNGELSDSSFIAVGKMSYDSVSGDSSIVYQFVSVKDSNGFLVSDLVSNANRNIGKSNNSKIFPADPWTWIVAATGQLTVETDHFKITFPNIHHPGDVQELANIFEEIRSKVIDDFGFTYYLSTNLDWEYSNWNWPIEVNIKDTYNKIRDASGFKPLLNVDGIVLGELEDFNIKVLICKILLSTAIDTHFEEGYDSNWFTTAIFEWLNDYFGNKTPDNLLINPLAPFNGMQSNVQRGYDHSSHAHGMISFIKYLTNKENLKIFEKIINANEYFYYPVKALLYNVNGLVADWWPEYFEKLIKGEIYNISGSVFLNTENLGGTWDINSDDDKETIFTNNYHDLSAKRFIVNLNYPDIDEDASLYLDATGNSGYDGIATLVFGINSSNNLQHLVTAKNGTAAIPNLKQYYDNGTRQFLVVVVNSMHNGTDYLGDSNIELKMEVKVEENDYNYCSVSVRTNYDIHDDGTLWGVNDFSADRTIDHGFNGNMVDGIFTGTAYPTDQFGNTYTGNINVNLNGSINSFSMELTENKYIENHTLYWGKNVTEVGNYKIQGGGGIPSISDSQYKVEGSSTCSHLTENNFTRYLEIFNPYSGTLENTVNESSTNSYSCNGGSYISITFSKQ
jgi:hypothetical protein